MKEPTDTDRINYLAHAEREQTAEHNATERAEGNLDPETDVLVLAMDGTTCWGKTYREALDNAIKHDGYPVKGKQP